MHGCGIKAIRDSRRIGMLRAALMAVALWGGLPSLMLGGQDTRLPRPTGPFAVGTTTRSWTDTTRRERFTGDPHDSRSINVRIWYPSASGMGNPQSPYLAIPEPARRLLDSTYLERAGGLKTNAAVGAPAIRSQGRIPVVVLSHDVGSLPGHYSILAEELASQGYLVAGINHSFGSATTLRPRGRVARLHPLWRGNMGLTREAESFRSAGVEEWAADVSFVLDRLSEEHRAQAEFFSGMLDLGRMAVVGHGHGGDAALYAAQIDRRIRTAVNLDGAARSIHVEVAVDFPLLWMFSDPARIDTVRAARARGTGARQLTSYMRFLDANRDSVLANINRSGYLAVMLGSNTDHFSDMPWLYSQTPGQPAGESSDGYLDPLRAADIVRTFVVTFLAMHMEHANARELELLAPRYPEVRLGAVGR